MVALARTQGEPVFFRVEDVHDRGRTIDGERRRLA